MASLIKAIRNDGQYWEARGNMAQFDKEEIRKSAAGHWIRIFEQFAGDVLEDALNRIGRHVDCPFHPKGRDGTNDFRLDYHVNENGKAFCNCGNFDGFELVMRANEWTFPIVLQEISSFLGIESTQTNGRWRKKPSREDIKRNQQKSKEMAIKQQLINERTEKSIQQILDGCCDYEHPRAIEYFKHRGIDVDILPDSILFHPNLIYRGNDDYGKDFISYFPALIGLYQRVDDEFVNILRIYLSNQNPGKADVEAPKKQWSPIRPKATNGAAIRLGPATEHIAIAEGIETAMAVKYATNLTTWAVG